MKTKSQESKRILISFSVVLLLFLSAALFVLTNSCRKLPGDSITEPVKGELKDGIPALYYGHEIFTRPTGNPVTELRDIVNPLFDAFEEDGFVLNIQNGDGENNLVSSAVIKIDGVQIFGPSDFSKQHTFLSSPVTLTENSVLSVKLNGKPGTFIDLWIDGIKNETGLVAYYPFNGNADDESGFNNDGALNGPTLTADRFGNENAAYFFDGTDDYIRIEESPSLKVTTSLSVCAWVNCAEFTFNHRIVSKWGYGSPYYCAYHISFNPLHFAVSPENNPTTVWGDPLLTNVWYFLVGTYDGENIRYYVNGELIGTVPFADILCQEDIPLYIGCENGTWLHFNGTIDDVRIYNRALTEDEIGELYEIE